MGLQDRIPAQVSQVLAERSLRLLLGVADVGHANIAISADDVPVVRDDFDGHVLLSIETEQQNPDNDGHPKGARHDEKSNCCFSQ
jgi:hypothetical protein